MPQQEPRHGEPLRPLDWLKAVPFVPAAWSDRLGWVGLEAVCCRTEHAFELDQPALTHHWLALFVRPPQELDLRFEGVRRYRPPRAGSIMLVPAGSPAEWRWSGRRDLLSIYLEPGLVARVAAEAFDLDPARLTVPPLDSLDLPHLRAAMAAVGAELTGGGPGGPLAAESLANILAVHLIRHIVAPRRVVRGRDGTLPRRRLRAVLEYIEEHLDAAPTLTEIAAVTGLNPYHFARQFRAATGLPPHQFVIARRVDRAKQLLQSKSDASIAEVAALVGFSDQSKLSRHFKRLVGVTPGQFRTPAKAA
ncbi:MAG TPA: AraC family transcriptional regulator [Gemmataceae bacterium]|nr:AraC family transcriptional regulator [Gemmataceae bacterium]